VDAVVNLFVELLDAVIVKSLLGESTVATYDCPLTATT
jgi:hypothetical protein